MCGAVRTVLWSLSVMAVVVTLGVGAQQECILNDEASLSTCVKRLLEGLRDDVHQKHDPVIIKDVEGCDGRLCHKLSNIRIHGVSGYNIQDLQVAFSGEQITLSTSITWSRLYGNMAARLKQSARILRKRVSAHVSADPEIRVTNPTGTLNAALRIELSEDGQITATPENVDVKVTLSDIDVELNLHGIGKWVDRIIGNPVDKLANLIVNHFWKREWKRKVELEAEQALEEAVRDKLGPELNKLLSKAAGAE